MADEAFALSPISARPVMPSDADYDAIREAFMETSRGRWFLIEYAKRNRNADTRMVLDAVARIEQTLAAQKQTGAETGAESLVAIRAIIGEAQATVAKATAVFDDSVTLTAAFQAARIIHEVASTLRECGADTRICDLLDQQVAAIDSGHRLLAAFDRDAIDAAFDQMLSRVGELSGGKADGAAAKAEHDQPAPSAAAANGDVAAAMPAQPEPATGLAGQAAADEAAAAIAEPAIAGAAIAEAGAAIQAAAEVGIAAVSPLETDELELIEAAGEAEQPACGEAVAADTILEIASAEAFAPVETVAPIETLSPIEVVAVSEVVAATESFAPTEAFAPTETAAPTLDDDAGHLLAEVIALDAETAEDDAVLDLVAREMSAPDLSSPYESAALPEPVAAELPQAEIEADIAAIQQALCEPAEPVADEAFSAPSPMAEAIDAPSLLADVGLGNSSELEDTAMPAMTVAASTAADDDANADAAAPSLGEALLASGVVASPSPVRGDVLVPIRRMSQAEKIAFFS